ncbi:MAG: glycosyltransferase family 9 protein, partial [bacterium]|nr:glycosyltransferase family 9 protein [bacterium]
YINRVLIYNLTSVLQLQSEHFDTVINLEKVPGLCALSDQVTAWRRYGFRFDVKTGEAEAYDGTQNAFSLVQDHKKKKNHNKCWQEYLFEMVDAKWNGEEYLFGYEPRGKEIFDVGFNFKVGNKWPTKAWPTENWEKLETLLSGNYTVSRQQGLDDMEDYFEWIHSCKLLVTNDSLGLHLALAMKKRVLAFFGPTNPKETHLYERGVFLVPESTGEACEYLPCYSPKCLREDGLCIASIRPETAYEKICELMEAFRG